MKRHRLERVQELQRLVTAERYDAWIGRHVSALVDRPADENGVVQARLEAQGDDIDGVTWITTDAPAGTLLEVRLDEVVDDFDFRATVVRTIETPASHPAPRSGRILPVAAGSVGSFGR